MGGTSTAFAFEQALIASLSDVTLHPVLHGVQILDGPPTAGQAQSGEFILFGNSSGGQVYKTFPHTAPTSKDETYEIDLLVDVVKAINDAQTTVTERAFVLLAEIENELRTNPSQSVPYVIWGEIARQIRVEKATNQNQGWRETLLRTTIYVRARL